MNFNKFEDLFKIAVILYTIILLVVGFGAGYLKYYDKEAYDTPLVYGIKQIDKDTNDNYQCSCIPQSIENPTLIFNSDGLEIGSFIVE